MYISKNNPRPSSNSEPSNNKSIMEVYKLVAENTNLKEQLNQLQTEHDLLKQDYNKLERDLKIKDNLM